MIRGMISGVFWGGVVGAGLFVGLTQFGTRIDVVRAAVPPVAVDAAGGAAPTVDAGAGATGAALGTAPAVGDTPQPGQQPDSETPVDGSGDVTPPATISVDGVASATAPNSEDVTGPVQGQAPDVPRSPQADLPQTGADGVPARVPDAPVPATGEAVDAPDMPVLPGAGDTGPDAPTLANDGGGLASTTPDVPGAPEATPGDQTVTGAAPPSAPGTIATPGDPTSPAGLADGVSVPDADARPTTPRPAAPGVAARDDLGDDVLAALAPQDTPRPEPDGGGVEGDIEGDIEEGADPANPASDQEGEEVEQPQTEAARSAARVVVNRLPRIGDPVPGAEAADPASADADTGADADSDAAAADGSEAQPAGDAAPSDGQDDASDAPDVAAGDDTPGAASVADAPEGSGALYTNAVTFDRVEGQPVMAVVLIDDPNANTNFSALPIAVTIAVESDSVGSVQRAQAHREAGREVVLIPPISGSDSRADIADRMANAMSAVPEAVAVMDLPEQPYQRSRFAVGEVMVAVAGTGHGMIIYPGGLNTAERLATQQNVATNRVFRDIDGGGQDLAAVKLLLDQAAFQARQLDSVILIGRNRPDTVQALAEWADGRLDDTVKLAPVSAALKP